MKAQYFPASIFMCFPVNQSWSQLENFFIIIIFFLKTKYFHATNKAWLHRGPVADELWVLENVKGLADDLLWLNIYQVSLSLLIFWDLLKCEITLCFSLS